MTKMRRNTCVIACKILCENNAYPLINFAWIMAALLFAFAFLFSEASASNPKINGQRLTLSLKKVEFSTEKTTKNETGNSKDEKKTTKTSKTKNGMADLQKAYEKFDVYRQNLVEKDGLVCAKVFDCLNPLLEGSKKKLPINPQKPKKNGKFTSESEEYYSLLRDKRFQAEITVVIELAKEGKSLENDKQAFMNNETRQSKRLTKITRELLDKYDSLRQSMGKKYPKIVDKRLPLIEDF